MLQPIGSLILAIAAIAVSVAARADDVAVAIATNFAAPMKRLAPAFERDTGHRIVPSFGSTGQLYAQIRNGAPFEVLLSADDETPARLVKEQGALGETQFTYARGRLALWSAKPGMIDDAGAVLKQAAFDRIAIANPAVAPYGAAAVETLRKLGLHQALQPKFVMGQNIQQTHHFVASGNAALGFVALSQVYRDGAIAAGSAWIVPEHLHEPLRQDAVVLTRGRGRPAAEALMRFLRTEKARALIRSHGYEL